MASCPAAIANGPWQQVVEIRNPEDHGIPAKIVEANKSKVGPYECGHCGLIWYVGDDITPVGWMAGGTLDRPPGLSN